MPLPRFHDLDVHAAIGMACPLVFKIFKKIGVNLDTIQPKLEKYRVQLYTHRLLANLYEITFNTSMSLMGSRRKCCSTFISPAR